ncbi:hypothetical protein PAMP_023300 [Pampus punctatissimus]
MLDCRRWDANLNLQKQQQEEEEEEGLEQPLKTTHQQEVEVFVDETCSLCEPPQACDRHRFAPGEKCDEVEPAAPVLSTCSGHPAENYKSTKRKQRRFHPLRGAGESGPPLTARRHLFMEASTSDPADCKLSGSDYLTMETCFYFPSAPVSPGGQRAADRRGRPWPLK